LNNYQTKGEKMKIRSRVIKVSAAAISVALVVISGVTPANADMYGDQRPGYPHYAMYQIHLDKPVAKYWWSRTAGSAPTVGGFSGYINYSSPLGSFSVGGNNIGGWKMKEMNQGHGYNAINICALDGKGGSRKVNIYKNTGGMAWYPDKNNNIIDPPLYDAPTTGWTFHKQWVVPICGKSSGGGGNPRAANGGLDTGSNKLGFGSYWFKLERVDDTSPTVFCVDQSYNTRTDQIPDRDTKRECVPGGKHDKYIGDTMTDHILNEVEP